MVVRRGWYACHALLLGFVEEEIGAQGWVVAGLERDANCFAGYEGSVPGLGIFGELRRLARGRTLRCHYPGREIEHRGGDGDDDWLKARLYTGETWADGGEEQ